MDPKLSSDKRDFVISAPQFNSMLALGRVDFQQ